VSVRYALLGFLSARSMHGYELKSRFDDATGGFWQLNFGQIYSTLDRLEQDGLVERVGELVEGQPDRKVFRITVRGRNELQEWVGKPSSAPRALRDDLFVRLLFCDKSRPDQVQHMIARQRDVYRFNMQKLSKKKAELQRLDLGDQAFVTDLLMDAALFHAEAELKWLSHVEQKLTERWAGRAEQPARA
jgi:DNA-binding PadR family transcriptional regulator